MNQLPRTRRKVAFPPPLETGLSRMGISFDWLQMLAFYDPVVQSLLSCRRLYMCVFYGS